MTAQVADKTIRRIAALAAPHEAASLQRDSVRWHDFRRIAAATLAVAADKPDLEDGKALLDSI